MSDINLTIIAGRLTQDPIARTTPSGVSIAEITLAHNTTSKNSHGDRIEKASYIYITAYRATAEFATKYLTKGRKILVQGTLRQEAWQDPKTGQNRHKTYVIADTIQFLDSKPQDTPHNQSPTPHHTAKANGYQPQQNNWHPDTADIPF